MRLVFVLAVLIISGPPLAAQQPTPSDSARSDTTQRDTAQRDT
jgi:hypothetical protein